MILHCHFERGGVTQVVENHVAALQASGVGQIVLVSGPRVSGLSRATREATTSVVVDDFDYDPELLEGRNTQQRSAAILSQLEPRLVELGIDREQAVLHWHNHSLGKNTAAPALIAQLSDHGWRLLLQVHDFAEDNRPENYLRLIRETGAKESAELDRYLYPIANQIHYATLTRGDADVLAALGVAAHHTHVMPNSVVSPDSRALSREEALGRVRRSMKLPSDARWCLYPVRGIRRKNVGEFVLLCRWLGENRYGGITLCPETQVEKRSYLRWREIATDVAPRAVFDAAHHPDISFADNICAADYIVSTSVAEGFGMAYLEPWLAGRAVIARRLSSVMGDFEETGVQLPSLYDGIPIPGDPNWLRQCNDEIDQAHSEAWHDVPKPFRPTLSAAQERADSIDFARLTPKRQVEVLYRMNTDEGFDTEVRARSRDLLKLLTSEPDADLIDHNRDVIGREYSLSRQSDQLMRVYRTMVEDSKITSVTTPDQVGAAAALVSQSRPFFSCRTETFASEVSLDE